MSTAGHRVSGRELDDRIHDGTWVHGLVPGTMVSNPSTKDDSSSPVWSEIIRRITSEKGLLYKAELLGS